MRNDAPAALPLLAFILGLISGLTTVEAIGIAAIAVMLFRFHRASSLAFAFFAVGILLTPKPSEVPITDGFTNVEVPIESDWSIRGQTYVLRSSRFIVGGRTFDAPVSLYARFEPPPIGMQSLAIAEGQLRRSSDGRYSVTVKSALLLRYAGAVSRFAPSTWNRIAHQRLQRHAPAHPNEISMIEALVLGRGERLSNDARQNFRKGGTYHLLVFSGLQIALAAGAIAFLLRWAGAPRVSDWLLIVFAALAPAFIGPTASVSRSSVGIGLYALSRILKRPTSFENLWCAAALARLILAPTDLTDPAFHLTYAGAGALIFIGKPLAKRFRWIAYALAAEIVITPLTLLHFHQFALGGSVTTIVLTPVIFVMLMAGALFCAFPLTPLLHVITLLNTVCMMVNDCSAPLSGFFAAPGAQVFATIAVAAVIAIFTLRNGRRAGAIALLLVVPSAHAIAIDLRGRNVRDPQFVFLDVGQGDAILLRSGTRNVLVDGGGRSEDARFGETVLLPMLVDRGVRDIAIVVLSHPHPDHCGGLPAVLEQLRVGEVWLNPRAFRGACAALMLDALRASDASVRLIRDDVVAPAGEMRLHAFVAQRPFRRAPENNSSIVMRVVTRGRSLLLTGDIESEAEADLTPRIEHADVLKVAHHGSRSSSTPPLLAAVSPRVAVISCGANNWFGHPHATVLKSLTQHNIRTWRIDRAGTVEMRVDGPIFIRGQFDTPR